MFEIQCLLLINQINQIHQINQINQTNQINQEDKKRQKIPQARSTQHNTPEQQPPQPMF